MKPERSTGSGIGVVDVGSNSIRLAIFAEASRALLPIFNEKVLCGLGRGLAETGRLNPKGVASALENLARFVAMAEAMGARDLLAFATAAVREAGDGPEFLHLVKEQCGLDIRLMSGGEEARLSALGVVSSIPEAEGVVGDLGGGSLELISVGEERVMETATLPLGPFRVPGDLRYAELVEFVDAELSALPWLEEARGKALYPVGGSWRSIARVHMRHVRYPLRVIHHYKIGARAAADFGAVVSKLSGQTLRRLKGAPKRRLDVLPHGALVLSRLIERVQPSSVVFSSYGVREGMIFDMLGPEERAQDPLIEAAREMARRGGRFRPDGDSLVEWLSPLLPEAGPVRRLARAACWLGDISGLDHPDYRGEHAYFRVLRMPAVAIDHAERSLLALALLSRYEGDIDADFTTETKKLLNEEDLAVAQIIGLALRLAFAVGAGSTERVRATRLQLSARRLTLRVPRNGAGYRGDVVTRRLEGLAKALGRTAEIRAAA